jgi:hypothetical protein
MKHLESPWYTLHRSPAQDMAADKLSAMRASCEGRFGTGFFFGFLLCYEKSEPVRWTWNSKHDGDNGFNSVWHKISQRVFHLFIWYCLSNRDTIETICRCKPQFMHQKHASTCISICPCILYTPCPILNPPKRGILVSPITSELRR